MQDRSLLNRLQREVPEGLVVDAAWLDRRGYYRSLRQGYVDRGWLERSARRVYRRPRGELAWEQVVISLQTLLERRVAVGGRTALELAGYAHYVPQNEGEVHLYADGGLPTWLDTLPLPNRFVRHNSARLFMTTPPGLTSADLEGAVENSEEWTRAGFTTVRWGQWNWPMVVSTPERAVLELLDELPSRESFHQVDRLVEGLTTLRPRRLQELLSECRSVKVKRLFFYFADRHENGWLDQLDRANVDLGSGKRSLVPGGRLDPTYNITVPEDMDDVP